MKHLIKFILAILLTALITTISSAQIPRTLSYQGVLTDSSGNPKTDGVYSLVFRLYDTPTGGAEMWREFKDIEIKRGLFSTQLGDQTQFEPLLNFTQQYWLSIQLGRDPEMLPRIPLNSVAYSFNSINAESSQVALTTLDDAITTTKLGNSAVTTVKIEENAITSNKIADGTIQAVDVSNSQIVKSLNGLKDDIFIKGAGGATVTSNNDSIIITAGGGGGGTGIQGVENTNNTIDISNPNGPTATINLKLPLAGSSSTSSPTLSMSNTSTGIGISGSSVGSDGIVGSTGSATKSGIWGNNTGGGYGVAGSTAGSITAGVWGSNSASGIGVKGSSTNGDAIYGITTNGFNGVYGESERSNGTGVHGRANGGTSAWGVFGESSTGIGVRGISNSGTGVSGISIGTGSGVYGYMSGTGRAGLFEVDNPTNNLSGLFAKHNGTGNGFASVHTGTGRAGYFEINNPSSSNIAFYTLTNGTGSAIYATGKGKTRSNATLRIENTEPVQGMSAYIHNNSNYATSHFQNDGSGEVLWVENHGTGHYIVATSGTDWKFWVDNEGVTHTKVLEIIGGSDLSERFELIDDDKTIEPGMVVRIDSEHEGQLAISREPYDRRVAGIISGAGGIQPGMVMGQNGSIADGNYPIALTGRVYCRVTTSNGPIAPGDLLTTSEVPGYAMRVDDHARAQGAIIGKAMGSLQTGDGLILVLVNLQ